MFRLAQLIMLAPCLISVFLATLALAFSLPKGPKDRIGDPGHMFDRDEFKVEFHRWSSEAGCTPGDPSELGKDTINAMHQDCHNYSPFHSYRWFWQNEVKSQKIEDYGECYVMVFSEPGCKGDHFKHNAATGRGEHCWNAGSDYGLAMTSARAYCWKDGKLAD